MKNLIFLDIDGVLNCQLHYEATPNPHKDSTKEEFTDYHFCKTRIGWLNELCQETNSVVVISSTWRSDGLEEMQEVFKRNGATFEIMDITPYCKCRVRGVEIDKWLKDNTFLRFGVASHEFYRFVIIDDDSDMMLYQGPHFFQTDTYSGLTPNTCYRIKRFLTHKTF